MNTQGADIARLSLLIQRILDAEVLYEPDSEALFTEAEAACRSLEEGDTEAARQHIAQVALFTEALVRTDVLDPVDGRAVLETAQRLLAGDSD